MAGLSEILGYDVLATLGHGARSTIFAVQDKKGQLYALKRVVKESPRDGRFLEQAVHEHRVARQFNHPVLRKSYRLIRHRALLRTAEVLVLMELVDGLSLEQNRPRSMLHLCQVCRHVAEGLAAMHEAGYVHADMKPNNVIVTDKGDVKIIDFGQSCPAGTIKERIQGTPDYIAPEQVLRHKISPQTDVFNLGATMYWLTTNRFVPTLIPKGEPGTVPRPEVNAGCPPPREVNDLVPPALSTLIMNCIRTEPRERPTHMQHVIERLDMAMGQLAAAANGAGVADPTN
jgi:eukaryotic-like serine/threonine-protein kinase